MNPFDIYYGPASYDFQPEDTDDDREPETLLRLVTQENSDGAYRRRAYEVEA